MNNSIAIILPVYNCEKYLSKCIDSLINQTHKEIEIVCVNDGSTDKSGTILDKFAKTDSRIKVIHQNNLGPASARNAGLSSSNGEYIMFCDSDDWYEKDMCHKMLKTIIEKKVDLVVCRASLNFEKGTKQIKRGIEKLIKRRFGRVILNDEERFKTSVLLWNKIFKRSIVKKYSITFPDSFEFDDDSFVYQYVAASKEAYYITDKLYNYLIRPNSIMASLNHSSRIDHINGSLAHTIQSIKSNNLIGSGYFINNICEKKISWTRNYLNISERTNLYNNFSTSVITLLDKEIVNKNDFLKNFQTNNFDDNFDYEVFQKKISKKHFLGIPLFKKLKTSNSSEYYYLGIKLYQQKKQNNKIIKYFFGIPIICRASKS